jgi:Lrp/AsnC family transcriptional regulator for asnA, asnC and gidA
MDIDQIDKGILKRLQENARMPFTKIAEELGVSDATIHLRVKKLEQYKVIEKYTTVINDAYLQPLTTYILIRVTPGYVEDVCHTLTQREDVYEVSEIHEQYDVLLKIRGDDLRQVRDLLIQHIRTIPHVVDSEAYTVYKTWKRDRGGEIAGEHKSS